MDKHWDLELDGESPRHSAIISSIVGEYANGGGVERIDLFEDYENIPQNVQTILDIYAEKFGDDFGDMDYKDMADMHNEIYAVGYTFDSYLDNQPYGLRPIGVPLNELKGYEDMGEYANGGGVDDQISSGGIKGKELWFSPYGGEVKTEKRGTAKDYIEKNLAKSFGAEYMELVGEDEKDYIYELNGNPMMIAAKTAILQEETDLDIETYGRKKRVHIPKKSIDQISVQLRYPLITPFKNGGGVGGVGDEKKVLRYRNKLVQMNVSKNEPSLDFAIKIIDMLVDGELVVSKSKDKEKQDQKSLKSILRHRNKLVQINVGKNEPSLDFAIKIIDMLVDGELIVKYAKGGGVGSMAGGNSKYWVWYVNELNPIKNEIKAQSFFTNDKQEAINFAYSVRRGYSKVAENKNNGFNSFMWLIDAIPTYEQDFNDTIPNRYTKRYDNGGGVDYDTRWAEMEAYSPYTSRAEYENKKEYEELAFASKTFSKTSEILVRENLNNGEICMCKLTKILGHEPNYPIQIVGSLKLEKCFMKRFYRIV